ncbi:hypothetical protein XBI1_2030004 [Xenorhabdus bovienii str. Intermedium]|uniref:Uncharacterized protein n=1 Tax=Xenorhabdus bovienii str. Intermedium TaxID=1379677 RepID=A0A077QHI7_XENBV|nr:hypothetical protein XBI1_2030004 [Xenorhabdus bovienii str. Intermedium]
MRTCCYAGGTNSGKPNISWLNDALNGFLAGNSATVKVFSGVIMAVFYPCMKNTSSRLLKKFGTHFTVKRDVLRFNKFGHFGKGIE